MKIQNRSRICLIISCAIIVLALVLSLAGRGPNLGVDFSGGLSMQYRMGQAVEQTDIESALSSIGVQGAVTVQGSNKDEVNIRVMDVGRDDIQKVQNDFETAVAEKYPDIQTIGDVSYVGPVAGRNLISNALLSVLIAAALMLVYIAIRFDFSSGLAAVLGLIHDVLLMLALMILFQVQMNSTFIAASLTIVGYSINNTIIIFDRIRENNRKLPNSDRVEIVNKSIRECLGRTINTTATTLLTIVSLYIFGVPSIKEFAAPIIFGILAGVYSANMINGYVWARLEGWRVNRKAAAEAAAKVKAKKA